MKTFNVILNYSQQSKGSIQIKANSQEEAEELAEDIQSDEVDNWNPYDGTVEVMSVEPAKREKKAKQEKLIKLQVMDGDLIEAINKVLEECDADVLASIAQNVLGGQIRPTPNGNDGFEIELTETYGGAFDYLESKQRRK